MDSMFVLAVLAVWTLVTGAEARVRSDYVRNDYEKFYADVPQKLHAKDNGNGVHVEFPCTLRYRNKTFRPVPYPPRTAYRVDLTWFSRKHGQRQTWNLYIWENNYDDRIDPDETRMYRTKQPYHKRYNLNIRNFDVNDGDRDYCCYLHINTHPSGTACTSTYYSEYNDNRVHFMCGEGYSNDEVIPVSADVPAIFKINIVQVYPRNRSLSLYHLPAGELLKPKIEESPNKNKANRFDILATLQWTKPGGHLFLLSLDAYDLEADEIGHRCQYTTYTPPSPLQVKTPSYPRYFNRRYYGCRVSFFSRSSVKAEMITFDVKINQINVYGRAAGCRYTISLAWWVGERRNKEQQCANVALPRRWKSIQAHQQPGSIDIPLDIEFTRGASSGHNGRYWFTIKAFDQRGNIAPEKLSMQCSEKPLPTEIFTTTTTTTTTTTWRSTTAKTTTPTPIPAETTVVSSPGYPRYHNSGLYTCKVEFIPAYEWAGWTNSIIFKLKNLGMATYGFGCPYTLTLTWLQGSWRNSRACILDASKPWHYHSGPKELYTLRAENDNSGHFILTIEFKANSLAIGFARYYASLKWKFHFSIQVQVLERSNNGGGVSGRIETSCTDRGYTLV